MASQRLSVNVPCRQNHQNEQNCTDADRHQCDDEFRRVGRNDEEQGDRGTDDKQGDAIESL